MLVGHGGFAGVDSVNWETAMAIVEKIRDDDEDEIIFKMQLAGVDKKTIDKMRRKKMANKTYKHKPIDAAERDEYMQIFDQIFEGKK